MAELHNKIALVTERSRELGALRRRRLLRPGHTSSYYAVPRRMRILS